MDLTAVIQTNFSNTQVIWIITALLSGFISIFLFLRKRIPLSLFFLLIAGAILRFLIAGLDPFLWTWDEQYHALVAKNMTGNLLKPVLISDPVLDYDFRAWKENHIWLHKQPWFLWQITLFFKIFGISEYILRLPTVIMMSILILVIYRIGSIVANRETAWFGAFLYSFSYFFINFISGAIPTDHNDAAFIFYVSLSIWAWVEYTNSEKRRWLFWIGLFAGIAVLNKWMVGLLVFAGWGSVILTCSPKEEWFIKFKQLTFSLLVTLVVALPWQIFILTTYPTESMFEFRFNMEHVFKVVEGHHEAWWYHFSLLSQQYGGIVVLFIILPGMYYLVKQIHFKSYRIALLIYLVVTYLFFTVAATKMPMFCTIVGPMIFLALGGFLKKCTDILNRLLPSPISFLTLLILISLLGVFYLQINRIDTEHSVRSAYWKKVRDDAILDKVMAEKLPSNDYVVFNCGGHNSTMFMFYTGITAYCFYPDQKQYNNLKQRKIKIATFADKDLPAYLAEDPEVVKLYSNPIPY
ncbi:MAG: glycosyltransferase family 39 protein [bacterium]